MEIPRDVIGSTEGQLPEGTKVPETPEFPPPLLMLSGIEYRLVPLIVPNPLRYHYYKPSPQNTGFSDSFKSFDKARLQDIVDGK